MPNSQLGGHIRVPKTAELLASRIRKKIVRGELKPGDRLPHEGDLLAEFEVSRPTVREAIRILESEGLINVTRGPQGGARVSAQSNDLLARTTGFALQSRGATLKGIYEARSLIEPPAARLAAEHRGKEAATALRVHMVREWATENDQAARAKAIADFHRILLEECGNTTLAVIGLALHDVVERHLELSYRVDGPGSKESPKRVRAGFKSHERLIELIDAGEGSAAEAHWAIHMKAAGEFWLKTVAARAVVDIFE